MYAARATATFRSLEDIGFLVVDDHRCTVLVHDEEHRTNAGRRKIATIRIAVVRLINLRSARFAQTAERERFLSLPLPLSLSLSLPLSQVSPSIAQEEKKKQRGSEREERDGEKEARERKTRRLSIRIERGARASPSIGRRITRRR